MIAHNITALINGSNELTPYRPGPAALLLPLGPSGGGARLPGKGIVDLEIVSQIKGEDLMTGRFSELSGTGAA